VITYASDAVQPMLAADFSRPPAFYCAFAVPLLPFPATNLNVPARLPITVSLPLLSSG
jgi:hypothetical protein